MPGLVVGAALLCLVSACSEAHEPADAPSAGTTTPTAAASDAAASAPSTSSPSTSGSPGSEPPEPPRARRGPAGQRAFARFVMEAWSWSLTANDATPLIAVSRSRKQPCDGCQALADTLEKRAEEGWYVDFPGLGLGRTRLSTAGGSVVATTRVEVPASNSFFEDGTYRSSSPAHPRATFVVRLRLTERGYRLLAFSVR